MTAHARGEILTINGGSSTIKFAVFSRERERLLTGAVERIGAGHQSLRIAEAGRDPERQPLSGPDRAGASQQLLGWLRSWLRNREFAAIGHRVVHGGVRLQKHQLISEELLQELCRSEDLDLAHLPGEIALMKIFRTGFPDAAQVACFDSAFFSGLPRVAQILPIPRRYREQGVRRLGFHGLSCAYLMGELRRIAPEQAGGRLILAHLGSGASMTAVRDGRPADTSMAFTPTAGLMMATRPGDLDPGLLVHLMRTEEMGPDRVDEFVNGECGLRGVSGSSADFRDLLAARGHDERAAEALDLFCYEAKKRIGAYAAALGGLDTIVFSGGIGEHSPEARSGICAGLEFLGVQIDQRKNVAGAPVISAPDSPVTVRVIATDEETVIAEIVSEFLT